MIDEMRRLTGTGVTSLLPIALGWLGECRFQTGDAAGALAPMEEARDEQGARAYLANLVEIHEGLALRADGDTRTRLLLSLALTLSLDAAERTELLREAASLNGNLTAGAMAALALKRAR